MLDRRFIRDNPDDVRDAVARRGMQVDVDRIVELDLEVVRIQQHRDDAKAAQRTASKDVPSLAGEAKAVAIAASKDFGRQVKGLEAQLPALESELTGLLLELPNIADPDVPEGLDAASNAELRTWGDKPEFDFEIKDHLDLATALGLIDMKRAARVAGSRWYYLRGDLVLLELALLRYALDLIVSRGYVPFSPPVMVNRAAMEGTGYLPIGADQAYECTRDDGWLIGTSEVPLTALHAGEILNLDDLPLRYAGYSNCFRREAGAHGKDTRGIFRVHQFMKIEQVVIAHADEAESKRLHEEILQNAEDVMQGLRLPYRVVALCAGDLGRQSAFTYDIETWMPGRGEYGETHSASRYKDFQARRLNLRYRDGDQKVRHCHTLNNTVIASTRALVAILENYQQKDGSVLVPEVLVPYMGKDRLSS